MFYVTMFYAPIAMHLKEILTLRSFLMLTLKKKLRVEGWNLSRVTIMLHKVSLQCTNAREFSQGVQAHSLIGLNNQKIG
jgi:hypothetical protein